jgi:hypothetical protein
MWLFETICPKCLKLNPRYSVPVHDQSLPTCLGVTCECSFEYIAIANQVKCLSCPECTWELRGFKVMVINQYEVVSN